MTYKIEIGKVEWVMEKKTILIADDEERIVTLVSDFLNNAGYETVCTYNGVAALNAVKESNVDLCIIDIMMPEMDGWELTRKIREEYTMPIIMLSARSEEFDMLTGFDSGVDEYVTKPFSPAVLVKRVEALLRRGSAVDSNQKVQEGLVINADAFTATLDGQTLELTLKEFELLSYLYENSSLVLTRDQLLNAVWGYDYLGDSRTVDSHIARIRLKLGDYGAAHLKTIYGMGYKFEI